MPDDIAVAAETPSAALKRLQAGSGLSLRGVAQAAGRAGFNISHSQLAELLAEKRGFTAKTAGACAAVFGVLPEIFLAAPPPRPAGILPLAPGAVYLPFDRIETSPLNPRKTFDEAALAELAQSIDQFGVLQNLVVRPQEREGGFHWVVAGERRFRAIRHLVETGRWDGAAANVPCLIRPMSNAEHVAMALIENLHRVDVNPMEEAEAMAQLQLLDPAQFSTAALAAKISKTPRHVQERLAMVKRLAPEAKEALRAGTLNVTKARALIAAGPKQQVQLLGDMQMGWVKTPEDIARSIERANIPFEYGHFAHGLYHGPMLEDEETGKLLAYQDRGEFMRLQRQAIDAEAASFRSAGIGAVIVKDDCDSWKPGSYHAEQDRIAKAPAKLPKGAQSCVVIVLRGTGEAETYEKLMKLPPPPKSAKTAATQGKTFDPVAAVSAGRKIYAQQAKTRVLQTSLYYSPRLMDEALCAALIHDHSILGIRPADRGPQNRHILSPIVAAALKPFRDKLPKSLELQDVHFDMAMYPDDRERQAIDLMLKDLADGELRTLRQALLAARITSAEAGHVARLGDDAGAIDAAERLHIDMSAHWTIDDEYLQKLSKDELLELALELTLFHWGRLSQAHFSNKLKMAEQRQAILDFIGLHDEAARHVPPELAFGGTMFIEEGIRALARRHAKPEQTDLEDAIAEAAP